MAGRIKTEKEGRHLVCFWCCPPTKECKNVFADSIIFYLSNLSIFPAHGHLCLCHLAAVADGEGVFLTVFALHAAVSQPNVEGALDGARILEGAGVEDRYGLFGVA